MKAQESRVYAQLEGIPRKGEWNITVEVDGREKSTVRIVDMGILVNRLSKRLEALDAEESKGEPTRRHVVRCAQGGSVSLNL